MVAAVGLASMLIALSFAEVSSRFDGTGGPYLYTRAAFGRFPAFEVGWMMWFTRAASWASVITVLVSSLGFYWPGVTTGINRVLLLSGIIAVLAAINIRGIRQSSFVVNLLTAGKLIPLAIFIAVGSVLHRLDGRGSSRAVDLDTTVDQRAPPHFCLWRIRGRTGSRRRSEGSADARSRSHSS